LKTCQVWAKIIYLKYFQNLTGFENLSGLGQNIYLKYFQNLTGFENLSGLGQNYLSEVF